MGVTARLAIYHKALLQCCSKSQVYMDYSSSKKWQVVV